MSNGDSKPIFLNWAGSETKEKLKNLKTVTTKRISSIESTKTSAVSGLSLSNKSVEKSKLSEDIKRLCIDPLNPKKQIIEYDPIFGKFKLKDIERIKKLKNSEITLEIGANNKKLEKNQYRLIIRMILSIVESGSGNTVIRKWIYEYGEAYIKKTILEKEAKFYEMSRITYSDNSAKSSKPKFNTPDEEYGYYRREALEAIRLSQALLELSSGLCACKKEDLTKEKEFFEKQQQSIEKQKIWIKKIKEYVSSWIVKPAPEKLWRLVSYGYGTLSHFETEVWPVSVSWDPSKTDDLLKSCKIPFDPISIYFKFNEPKNEIYKESNKERVLNDPSSLESAVEKLNKLKCTKKPINIKVMGYTDNIGTKNYNKKLSYRRAAWVIDCLKKKGASISNATTFACGISPTAPLGERSKAHRVVIIMFDEPSMH
jgi:hypothetical protein